METKNALIKSTQLGIEDHGLMSFSINLDYGDSFQGAGGYCLDGPRQDENGDFIKREGTAWGMSLIMEILNVVGVSNWEDLPGKHIRVKAHSTGVEAIGHITEDKWLTFKEFGKELQHEQRAR
jgi:hypothetical protein